MGAHPPGGQRGVGAEVAREGAATAGDERAARVLDEPAAGLAHPDVTVLVDIIKRVHQRGVTIILIEHHMDVVSTLCDVVTVLDGGKVIAEGTTEEVKRNPLVIKAYLGIADDTEVPDVIPAVI